MKDKLRSAKFEKCGVSCLIFFLLCSVYLITTQGYIQSSDGMSSYLTTRSIAEEGNEMLIAAITEILFPMIIPGEDNRNKLCLLETINGIDVKSVREFLQKSEDNLRSERIIREKAFAAMLKKKGVSGSAVIPNVEADPEWIQNMQLIRKEFREKVNSVS